MSQVQDKAPFLSIITVNYNSAEVLEKTISSIISQSSQNFEYIIIDGKSTDGSLDIINKYKDKINTIISEPDKGLYDAMNKGIFLANGNFLWFLNAGDIISTSNTIEKLEHFSASDIIYSDTIVIDQNDNELGLLSKLTHNNAPKNLHWKDMERGMVVCHQSFLVRKEIAPKFDLNYRFSADIDWVIKCLKNSQKNSQTNFIISKFQSGGLSKQHLRASMKERYVILKKHFGFFRNLYNHVYLAYRYWTTGRNSKLNQI